MEIFGDSQDLSFAKDCLNSCRVAPGIRRSVITNTLVEGLCQKAALDDILILSSCSCRSLMLRPSSRFS